MKNFIAALAFLAFLPGIALAQTTQETNTDTQVQQSSDAQAIVGGTTFNSQTEQVAATAVAPSYGVNGQWVCPELQFSAALQLPGGGASVGRGGIDAGCNWLREVVTMRAGNTPLERAAAAVRSCTGSPQTRESFELLGFTCQDAGRWVLNYLTSNPQQPAAQRSAATPPPTPPQSQPASVQPEQLRGRSEDARTTRARADQPDL